MYDDDDFTLSGSKISGAHAEQPSAECFSSEKLNSICSSPAAVAAVKTDAIQFFCS
jgi:hypothetical protein